MNDFEERPRVRCPKCEPHGSMVEIQERYEFGRVVPTYYCWDCGFSKPKDSEFWDDYRVEDE